MLSNLQVSFLCLQLLQVCLTSLWDIMKFFQLQKKNNILKSKKKKKQLITLTLYWINTIIIIDSWYQTMPKQQMQEVVARSCREHKWNHY